MNKILRVILISVFVLAFTGCTTMKKKKVDSEKIQRTDSGFEFAFNMQGDWYWGKPQSSQYMVGKKTSDDGSTAVVVVRHGPIYTPGGVSASKKQMLDNFEDDLKAQAEGGRVEGTKSTFSRKKHKGADCLFFNQVGRDRVASAAMNYEGVVCLHPKNAYRFILMGVSHRSKSENLMDTSDDLNRLIGSLEFI